MQQSHADSLCAPSIFAQNTQQNPTEQLIKLLSFVHVPEKKNLEEKVEAAALSLG